MQTSFKKTKIVATIGPASESADMLKQLIDAGMNVARLNFSHGKHEEHGKRIQLLRQLAKAYDKPIGIMQDLQGPKIRLGNLSNEARLLQIGQEVSFVLGFDQVNESIPIQTNIFPFLKKGDSLLINDGLVRIHIENVQNTTAIGKVVVGGEIRSHKGVNLPQTSLPSLSLTEKDQKDVAFGLMQQVDFVALSFVQTAQDIQALRQLIQKHDKQPKIIAKIECKQAIDHLEEIIQVADAVMVARGDLAVEVGQEEVPLLQREIIALCKKYAKPVIVATQMLESMVSHLEPTRAEVNDVATAVLDKVDAVMLSAESAFGAYPTEAVTMMDSIIRRIEQYPMKEKDEKIPFEPHIPQVKAIALSAVLLANTLQAKMIFAVTQSGANPMQIAKFRPKMPIIALSDRQLTCNQLSLVWGVKCLSVEKITDNPKTFEKGISQAKEKGILQVEDTIVLVGGTHPGVSGQINTIRVEKLG